MVAASKLAVTTRRRLLLTSAACLAGTLPASARPMTSARGSWSPPQTLLDSLGDLMRLAGVPGLAIATVNDGALDWQGRFGVADADSRAPLNEDTLFEAASISKAVFAYMVLQLVDRGAVELDRPLASYHRPPYLPP